MKTFFSGCILSAADAAEEIIMIWKSYPTNPCGVSNLESNELEMKVRISIAEAVVVGTRSDRVFIGSDCDGMFEACSDCQSQDQFC